MAIDNKFANTRAVPIGSLLSQKQVLKVPRFQRNYDWDEEKVDALWNDMRENFDLVLRQSDLVRDAQYLLGPVVLVSNKNQKEVFVIDGQQRLATLTMLLCVARDIMFEHAVTDGIDKIEKLLVNEFMGKRGKWKLELNDTDKELFKEIQEYEPGEIPQLDRLNRSHKTKSQRLLADNYKFLHNKLLQFLDNNFSPDDSHAIRDIDTEDPNDIHERRKNNIPMMIHFIDFICEYNYVAMVMVDDDNTAFQIFETLNERGKTLSKSNLIKNHILNQITKQETQKEQSDRWNKIFDEMVGSNYQDDDFIMESYNSRDADNNSLRAKHQSNLDVSKKNLYKIIKNMIKKGDEKACKKFIGELENDAGFLSMLNDPSQYTDENSKEAIYVIKSLKAKFIRSMLLAAYRKWYDNKPKDYSELVKFMVKFFFKIRVVRQVHPGKIEKIVGSAIKMINGGKSSHDVISMLKEHDDHKDFNYNFINKFMPEPPKDAAKYVLQSITVSLGTKYDDVKPIDNLTLEHILPKSLENWNEAKFFEEYEGSKRIEDFTVRMGNLTLLKNAINKKMQNSTFEVKKDLKDKNGDLIGYSNSKLAINKRTVCNHDKWTANIIEDREKEFAKYADKIWNLG